MLYFIYCQELYEKVVVTTGIYGSGNWGMRTDEGRKLDSVETKCLRRMCSVMDGGMKS